MNTLVGVIVTVDEVCHAITGILQDYLPAALASIEDPAGRTIDAPTPESYAQVPTREAILQGEHALPAIGTFSPGLSGAPERDENGNWSKTWRVTVVCYVRGESYNDTQWMCRTVGPVIQAILVQNPQLGGVATDLLPMGETYDVVDATAARTLAGVAVDVDVLVDAAFSEVQPPYDAPGPPVLTTDTDVEVLHPALA